MIVAKYYTNSFICVNVYILFYFVCITIKDERDCNFFVSCDSGLIILKKMNHRVTNSNPQNILLFCCFAD